MPYLILNLQQNISADNAGNKLSNKTGIDLAQGDPSEKREHNSAHKDDNDPANKAKNSKVDSQDVAGNGEQPHNKLMYIY